MTLSPGQEATSPCDRGRENILLDPMDGDLHEPVMPLNTQHRVEGGPHVPCLMLFFLVSVKLQSRKYGTMANAAVDFKFAMQCKKKNNNTHSTTFLVLPAESFYFISCPGSVQVLVTM